MIFVVSQIRDLELFIKTSEPRSLGLQQDGILNKLQSVMATLANIQRLQYNYDCKRKFTQQNTSPGSKYSLISCTTLEFIDYENTKYRFIVK